MSETHINRARRLLAEAMRACNDLIIDGIPDEQRGDFEHLAGYAHDSLIQAEGYLDTVARRLADPVSMSEPPTDEQVKALRERLAYFEAELDKALARTDWDDDEGMSASERQANTVRYYRSEVGERRMLLAIWDHVMSPPGVPRYETTPAQPKP